MGRLALFFIAVLLKLSPAFGSLSQDQHFKDIKEHLQESRLKLVEAEIQKRGVLGALYEINKDLKKIEGDLADAQYQLNASKQLI